MTRSKVCSGKSGNYRGYPLAVRKGRTFVCKKKKCTFYFCISDLNGDCKTFFMILQSVINQMILQECNFSSLASRSCFGRQKESSALLRRQARISKLECYISLKSYNLLELNLVVCAFSTHPGYTSITLQGLGIVCSVIHLLCSSQIISNVNRFDGVATRKFRSNT